MNLMDMLSQDPPSSLYNPDLEREIQNGSEVNGVSNGNQHSISDMVTPMSTTGPITNNGIIYLPTTFTCLQKSLAEIILHLFSSELLNEVRSKKLKTNSSNEIQDNNNNNNNRQDKLALCFDQLWTIANHPSLLIDHFIPKKLLLSETSDRQLNMSGKIQFFNKIVDSLIEERKDTGYRMLVVSNNVKELELIEGIVIGKQLYYNNCSSAKLYDDRRPIPDMKEKSSEKLFVNLITSQQLYNNYISSSDDGYDFIFSFDSKLDVESPSIEILRDKSITKCPVLIPVSVFSLEHVSLQFPKPSSMNFSDSRTAIDHWKIKCINTLAVNLFNLQDLTREFFIDNYGANMKGFLDAMKENPIKLGELLEKYTSKLALSFSDDKLIKKLNGFYGDGQGFDQIKSGDYHEFKSRLAEALHVKLSELSQNSAAIEEKLREKRKFETSRQVHYDEDEDLIAENYRKLQKLNDEASMSERKLGRIDNDLTKRQEKLNDANDKLEKLQELVKSELTPTEITEQEKTLNDLKEELQKVQDEFNKINEECDTNREKYQSSSSTALQLSNTLTNLKSQNEKIEGKLTGPGISQLPELLKRDTLVSYEMKLKKLKTENKFMQTFFQTRIDKLYQERQQLLDNTGSSSRPSNRISRATTPLQ
ncbi:HDA2 HDA1 complex subunit 2 [Candida maltosa Xu316]